MTRSYTRRRFVKETAAAGIGFGVLGGLSRHGVLGANERIHVAVVGVNSRGRALARTFARCQDVEVACLCDVDSGAIARTIQRVPELQQRIPKGLGDFRKALEDPAIDVVAIATPDHWHAPAAILALNAGKHVYVEKPCSHNPAEGEMLVRAARRSKKICQMGNQRRSESHTVEAIGLLKGGAIGPVHYVRCWYSRAREPIGVGKPAPVPEWLNWDLWQGPAPRVAYRDNVVHYNWHWFWHWGTSEAGNNAIHTLDLARWAIGDDFPTRVTSAGGRYYAQDDWQPPDTHMLSFEFPSRVLVTWEGMSCNAIGDYGEGSGALFQGEKGALRLHAGNGYTLYDEKGKEVRTAVGPGITDTTSLVGPGLNEDLVHVGNFLESIRGNAKPASEIEEGHKSTMMIHLGNIAQRTGRALTCDPRT
ncbi:MAG: Gfo/Idh/MocA family oxidoreductase, partial [Acidobacteria bacterium]|nr:Gfo/Idh/MocA family oxidoreductase [Acidobacteriota bacterium]